MPPPLVILVYISMAGLVSGQAVFDHLLRQVGQRDGHGGGASGLGGAGGKGHFLPPVGLG